MFARYNPGNNPISIIFPDVLFNCEDFTGVSIEFQFRPPSPSSSTFPLVKAVDHVTKIVSVTVNIFSIYCIFSRSFYAIEVTEFIIRLIHRLSCGNYARQMNKSRETREEDTVRCDNDRIRFPSV